MSPMIKPFQRSPGAQTRWIQRNSSALPRLQLQYGPIDLLIDVDASQADCACAYEQACNAFDGLLEELVEHLPLLRTPIHKSIDAETAAAAEFKQRTVTAMLAAVAPYASDRADTTEAPDAAEYVTPMAAVAGAVADTVLQAMCKGNTLSRASVNNGGDIALYIGDSQRYCIGICSDIATGELTGSVDLTHPTPIGGIATSGWQGRSLSCGIANAVTVLATDAAIADVAATMIANHVFVDAPKQISQTPACEIDADSDLGRQLVTVDVKPLTHKQKLQALHNGTRYAQTLLNQQRIQAAWIHVQGEQRVVDARPLCVEKLLRSA